MKIMESGARQFVRPESQSNKGAGPATGMGKRRTDRVMLTVRLKVRGSDARGIRFKVDGHTITLNRHGAMIYTSQVLHVGQVVRLMNEIRAHDADFRVVGPVAPRSERGGAWGVECLEENGYYWGIRFPLLPDAESAYAKGLLECRLCHAVTMARLSAVEVEVLSTAGILTLPCEVCKTNSPWGYAESILTEGTITREKREFDSTASKREGTSRGVDLRRHTRVSLQLPVLVRDFYGGLETSKSENISKGGFCLVSEKTYFMGQGIFVACPYRNNGESIEVAARIVRVREVNGTASKIYGIRYDPPAT